MAAKTKTTQAPAKGEKPDTEKKEIKRAAAPKKQETARAKQPVTNEDKVMAHLKLHGKEFVGTVISDRATKTVTVEWERRRLIAKYERYEKRYSRVYAHNPITINAKMGDTVRIQETRPLSKTKNFVVVEVIKKAGETQ
jgi:small subunit ribosomal protein S17